MISYDIIFYSPPPPPPPPPIAMMIPVMTQAKQRRSLLVDVARWGRN